MRDLLPANRPALVLAPMQDVTNLPFVRVLAKRSLPDWFVTEYFRVHPDSKLNRNILKTITGNPTERPMFAQIIGSDLTSLVRAAGELAAYPIAGIDLNLGCPAPIVCRKEAGGGVLRKPDQVNRLVGGLRDAIPGRFTVKTRIGYQSEQEFPQLLEIFQRHGIDGLTIHARTVRECYQGAVHTDCVRTAAETLHCPVIANGNIVDVNTGLAYHRMTSANGLMIGRGAIRNPWIFGQLQAAYENSSLKPPTYRELLEYIHELYAEIARETTRFNPLGHVQRMKRTLGYMSHGLTGTFEHEIRRCTTPEAFWSICHHHLESDSPLPQRPPVTSRLFSGFAMLMEEYAH